MTTEGTDPGGPCVDVVIIGAGVAGLYALHRALQLGFSARVVDGASGVGGTWVWSRYPGARFDSESYTYGYSFSDELLQEWDWAEHYAAQPDVERYLNHVADRFGLRPHIQLDTWVEGATFLEDEDRWSLDLSDGTTLRGQFLVAAVGILSAHYVPDVPGLDEFGGEWVHTGRWPAEGVALESRRVAVIGTGSTGVQIVPAIVDRVEHLTVFQRTANYCVPLRNRPIDPATMAEIKADYGDIFRRCWESSSGFMYSADPRSALEVTDEERLKVFEQLWSEPGFKKWLGNFYDVLMPGEANVLWSEFLKDKIRERVHDPVVAEMLVPHDHLFGAKRPPCEVGYYEVFNRNDVELVDVRATPIERITPTGIQTSAGHHDVDVIVFATGYDAITGSLTRIPIRGEGGLLLRDRFADGPHTYLGIQSAGFPNLFTVNSSIVGNYVRAIEPVVDWVVDCMAYLRANGYRRIVPAPEAEAAWGEHIADAASKSLLMTAASWMVGANIPGKARAVLTTPEPGPVIRQRRIDAAANGYEGFLLR